MTHVRKRGRVGSFAYGKIMSDNNATEEGPARGKSNLWVRLRKRLQRRGVVEVDIDHHRYKMLNCIREGIRNLLLKHPELRPKDRLTPDDYTHQVEESFQTKKGKTFTFCSYASSVFASIRRAVSVTEADYLAAVAPPSLPYLEFISNSKSGQDFFLSNDQQYILKTDKVYSVQFFLSFLGEYLEHFQIYPHSLIVKFLGLYSIQIEGEPKIYFLSMQSIFFPPSNIDTRFDVKGCLGGRYQKPNTSDEDILTILKDQNFEHETIRLGVQKAWFVKQLKVDVDFFRDLGVQDYSLLIGRQKCLKLEGKSSLQSVVQRVQRSMPHASRNSVSPMNDVCTVKQVGAASWEIEMKSIISETQAPSTNTPGKFTETKLSSENDNTIKQTGINDGTCSLKNLLQQSKESEKCLPSNLRLLPNCPNPLHVIDGEDYRYYLGIIDFFTQYQCWQRVAGVLKTVKNLTTDHSTVPPDVYADRFVKFISDRTK
ncbi:phosphatidylinositol 4-phosphate 5-kinase-like protein 1 [Mizuhopecten yessoensis]|uniref:Phosphatidylinositol 4-phosphate 5-kinase-like protein 1 n=1 Tax=Mizuhopecten yessoensis TaxID=6573 RepID=A0A210QIS6_MIZYE|nr:phosphatidylinositol 4-phosphate 5-kinase-like protein 1 [Mizuhopecten yessoensis]OWF48586.1 Phosphatidylinositol 4-phosphate 5-kinase-like protein 1 [Mizuhopecten yessoensis]